MGSGQGNRGMSKRQPLSPEAEKAVQDVMRKFCEDVERRKAERDADELAEAVGRLCDEMGPNV